MQEFVAMVDEKSDQFHSLRNSHEAFWEKRMNYHPEPKSLTNYVGKRLLISANSFLILLQSNVLNAFCKGSYDFLSPMGLDFLKKDD